MEGTAIHMHEIPSREKDRINVYASLLCKLPNGNCLGSQFIAPSVYRFEK